MANIRQGIQAALGIERAVVRDVGAVVGGVKDYISENNKAHADALKMTRAKQDTMITNIRANVGNAPTPMSENEFYGAAEETAKQLKKQRGVSLIGDIKKRMKQQ